MSDRLKHRFREFAIVIEFELARGWLCVGTEMYYIRGKRVQFALAVRAIESEMNIFGCELTFYGGT